MDILRVELWAFTNVFSFDGKQWLEKTVESQTDSIRVESSFNVAAVFNRHAIHHSF